MNYLSDAEACLILCKHGSKFYGHALHHLMNAFEKITKQLLQKEWSKFKNNNQLLISDFLIDIELGNILGKSAIYLIRNIEIEDDKCRSGGENYGIVKKNTE